jgi:copper chaperone CopZ
MTAAATFKTEFAVSLHCQDCVQSVGKLLKVQDGVERFDIDLVHQRVVVEGTGEPTTQPE